MSWGSLNQFFAMGGYAFYVWGAYAVGLILLLAEILVLRQRRRTLFRRLGLTHRPEARK